MFGQITVNRVQVPPRLPTGRAKRSQPRGGHARWQIVADRGGDAGFRVADHGAPSGRSSRRPNSPARSSRIKRHSSCARPPWRSASGTRNRFRRSRPGGRRSPARRGARPCGSVKSASRESFLRLTASRISVDRRALQREAANNPASRPRARPRCRSARAGMAATLCAPDWENMNASSASLKVSPSIATLPSSLVIGVNMTWPTSSWRVRSLTVAWFEEPFGVGPAHHDLVEPAPVAEDGGVAHGLAFVPPACVLIADQEAAVYVPPDIADIGLGLRRCARRAEIGPLDEGRVSISVRPLVKVALGILVHVYSFRLAAPIGRHFFNRSIEFHFALNGKFAGPKVGRDAATNGRRALTSKARREPNG